MLRMSATLLSSCLRYAFSNGSCQICSSVAALAARNRSTMLWLLPMTPATLVPSATMQAPVSVAMSTMASGASSTANDRPSASTRRPSASVLWISAVLPLRKVSTSPNLTALPPGMLSVHIR